jgi:molybdopterin-guanine dinucleotide biosynthesis protein A
MNKMKKQCTGVLLAGGKSSRMGQEKGLIEWKGSSFAKRIVEAMKPITNEIIIVSSTKEYEKLGCTVLADIYPNKGPMGGLYTGLWHAKNRAIIVVSCDTPLVSTALLLKLFQVGQGVEVCIPKNEGHVEPLVGYYTKACLPTMEQLIQDNNLKMSMLIESSAHRLLQLDGEEKGQLFNVNTKEDLIHLS